MPSSDNENDPFLDPSESSDEEQNHVTSWFTLKKLLSFTNRFERCIIVFGIFTACCTSVGFPLVAALIGNIGQTFIDIAKSMNNNTLTPQEKEEEMDHFINGMIFNCTVFLIIGIWELLTNWIFRTCIYYVSECLLNRLRTAFISHLLTLDAEEFDRASAGQFNVLLNYHIERIREGFNDRLGFVFISIFESSLALIIAFTTDWKLSLIAALTTPILAIYATFVVKLEAKSQEKKSEVYEKAGEICSQAISNIRTVIAFNGQHRELSEYEDLLKQSRSYALTYRTWGRILDVAAIFSMYFIQFVSYYFGTIYVYDGRLNGGQVVRVLFSIFFASTVLKDGANNLTEIGGAVISAKRLVHWLQKTSNIEGEASKKSQSPEIIEGRIEFANVYFSYPSRSSITVLKDISFSVKSGEKIAIVGASGSGKSSIIQLLLRNYEQNNGAMKIDDHELSEFDLKYLRQNVAVVSQEPILFSGTIEENISFAKPQATTSEVVDALKKANAYDFVVSFPKGIRTMVGERGTQLSGGQKQRIAIARALIRNPQIMLFDEATSALDSENESIVQKAIENACAGKTTITIAHRLSTIRNADRILVINKGQIIEVGTHQKLIDEQGEYYEMVMAQSLAEVDERPELRRSTSRHISTESHSVRRTISQQISHTSIASLEEPEEDEMDRLKRELAEEDASKGSLWQLISYTKFDMWLVVIGCIIATIHGLCKPALAYSYTKILEAYSRDSEEILEHGQRWALILLGIGLFDTFGTLFFRLALEVASENMMVCVQTDCFKQLLRMPVAYFDDPKHSSERLSTRLATDTTNARWAMDFPLGYFCSTITGFALACVVALIFGWQMAIITLTSFSLMAYFQRKVGMYLESVHHKETNALEAASRIAMESIDNIKTVRSLTMEKSVIDRFIGMTKVSHNENKKKAKIQALAFSVSHTAYYFVYTLNYAFGALMIYKGFMWPLNVYVVLFCVIEVMDSSDYTFSFFPDYIRARYAIGLIFKLLNETSSIDNLTESGEKPQDTTEVSFKDVEFRYPQRPGQAILKDFSLLFPSGKTTALVGESGSGKSTTISLVERFYDPNSGHVNLSSTRLEDIQPRYLRSKLSLVSQEPVLCNRTIRENVIYGLENDNISSDQIYQVLEHANIRSFVDSLPQGIETIIGVRGMELSGGQKQRIAISRALIRDPDILLLDEATSAMDSQNETLVQAALDKASSTRTTIIVAHRLSTVTNADRIVVMKNGTIVEQGISRTNVNFVN